MSGTVVGMHWSKKKFPRFYRSRNICPFRGVNLLLLSTVVRIILKDPVGSSPLNLITLSISNFAHVYKRYFIVSVGLEECASSVLQVKMQHQMNRVLQFFAGFNIIKVDLLKLDTYHYKFNSDLFVTL